MSFVLRLTLLFFSWLIHSSFLDDFEYTTVMDESEQFWIGWTVLNDTHIEFGLEVNATGWIAIGVSPTGQMPNSGVNLAYVDDDTGVAYLYDLYTVGKVRPLLSEKQTSVLLYGTQNNTKTYIKFIRLIQPCEDEIDNLGISEGTTRLLFAYQYQNKDPTDPNNVTYSMSWHGSGNTKGSRSINFLLPSTDDIPLPDTYEEVILTMDNIQVPSDDTTYMCKLMELPFRDEEQHIIRFEPVVTKGNEGVVHHFVVYACPMKYVNRSNLNTYMACDDYRNMPNPEISCIGYEYIYAWAIGGDALIFPDYVGLSMTGNDTDEDVRLQYIMLEIHYDNPNERSDIIDSSGVKIVYTPLLRTYEAGMLIVGTSTSSQGIFVPNNLGDTLIFGQCVSECTQILEETQLDNETYIFASFLHAHTIGKSLIARHIRDGKELKPIENNPTYDFNYQQFVKHDPEIKLLPNDEIIVECIYNSEDRDFITTGGESTREEMCLIFIYVYPKPTLAWCTSTIDNQDWDTFETEVLENGYVSDDYTKYAVNNSEAMELYNDLIIKNNQRTVSCSTPTDERIFLNKSYPKIKIKKNYKSPYDNICESSSNNNKSWFKKNLKWFIPCLIFVLIATLLFVFCYFKKLDSDKVNNYQQVDDIRSSFHNGETNSLSYN